MDPLHTLRISHLRALPPLLQDDPCSQDRAFLEFVDKLFEYATLNPTMHNVDEFALANRSTRPNRMLDADGDGNVSFTEFQMAFIVHPELMSKVRCESRRCCPLLQCVWKDTVRAHVVLTVMLPAKF